MRAAIQEFQECGLERAKKDVIAVAKAREVRQSSNYQLYFDDKKELFLYSVTWGMEYYIEDYRQADPALRIWTSMIYFLSGKPRTL